ncbi:MAG: hypothetical protein Q7T55_06550 [Solirubrobacteraceae bacterium]|nr:hypothetical protein [Solirubrobacteraceae bacterium]
MLLVHARAATISRVRSRTARGVVAMPAGTHTPAVIPAAPQLVDELAIVHALLEEAAWS